MMNEKGAIERLEKYKKYAEDSKTTVYDIDLHNACVNALKRSAKIEKTKQEIIERMQEFEAEYRSYSENTVDHFGGKADAMHTAIVIVKNAL